MATARKPPETRRILVNQSGGKKTLVEGIPANAKITFGKLQPGEGRGYPGSTENALRIYTTTNNQLAVFVGVNSFRDLSLTVKEQRTHKKLRSDAVTGPNGMYGEEQYEVHTTWEELSVDDIPEDDESGPNPFGELIAQPVRRR